MKLIFDFDDVLFDNKLFKKHLFSVIEKAGGNRESAEAYYRQVKNAFSLKNFLADIFKRENMRDSVEKTYAEIMEECKNLVNQELRSIIETAGANNCYLATFGEDEFQREKIKRCGLAPLFAEIYTTLGSKKEIVERICLAYPTEKIIFVDDKPEFFAGLDKEKCKNLKTILCDERGLEKLQAEIKSP